MSGLTTSEATFIEQARHDGQLYIHQPYELYTEENHRAWSTLYRRMLPRWERYANRHFRAGLEALKLDHDRVPCLKDVNRFLEPLTGFQAKAVSGYVPTFLFFDSLRNREFPTTITIRRGDHLDYLPEPDIFHDVAGHVPMHTDKHFAEAHNDYLQLLAEGGALVCIPAALAILAFAWTVRCRFLEVSVQSSDYWIRVGAITGILAIALQEISDFSLQMPGNAVLFVLLCGIAARQPSRSRLATHPSQRECPA